MTVVLRNSLPIDDATGAVAVAAVGSASAAGDSAPSQQTALRKTKALTSAPVNVSSSGDNTIIAAAASQTTRVHRLILVPAADVSIGIKTGTTTKLQPIPIKLGGSIVLDLTSEPWFETLANNAVIVNLSSAVAVTGMVEYVTSA